MKPEGLCNKLERGCLFYDLATNCQAVRRMQELLAGAQAWFLAMFPTRDLCLDASADAAGVVLKARRMTDQPVKLDKKPKQCQDDALAEISPKPGFEVWAAR